MKTLKELGLTFKDVKAVCGSFNDCQLAETKIRLVGITGEAMIVELIARIDAVADEDMNKIPKDVQDFYEALPDEVFNINIKPVELAAPVVPPVSEQTGDERVVPSGRRVEDKGPAGRKEEAPAIAETPKKGGAKKGTKVPAEVPETPVVTPAEPTAETSTCPDFGTGFAEGAQVCIVCGQDFPAEHINCKRTMRGVPVPEPAPAKKPSLGVMKSRYGHRINTMAGCIDDMIWAGTKLTKIAARVVKWYGKSPEATTAAVLRHIKYLPNARGINTVIAEDGTAKSDKEFSTGQNAQNTAKAVPSVVQEKK